MLIADSKSDKHEGMKETVRRRLTVFALLPLSCAIGASAEREHHIIAACLASILAVVYLSFCRFSRIEFGQQGYLPKQCLVDLLLSAPLMLGLGLPWALTYQLKEMTDDQLSVLTGTFWQLLGLLTVIASAIHIVLVGTRTLALLGGLICIIRGLAPLVTSMGETPAHSIWLGFIIGTTAVFVGFVRYRMEQWSLAFVSLVIGTSIHAGGYWSKKRAQTAGWELLAALFAYFLILWMRRKRKLPPSLTGCKFVRLAYLRKIAASGEGIRRCQDLPPEAFGDPTKARHLVVVSHRWMDRYTCDLRTDSHPEGLRLHTLLKKLDSIFSTAGIGKGQGFLGGILRFRYSLIGGSDVLIFFDFMSLPQVGRLDDGSIVPRTLEETAIFQECLPSMGTLYSMFPVLVCDEVVEGMPAYLESGWCFSESSTAWLGRQLSSFPANAGVEQWLNQCIADHEDFQGVGRDLDNILASKSFLFETDRSISRTMTGGFVLKRRLMASLQRKASGELEVVLRDIRQGGFERLLDQPVDPFLNTPLHWAVAMNFLEGVRLLMDAGANKALRNIHGDTPVQLHMLPRPCAAARLCRSLQPRKQTFTRDSMSELASQFVVDSSVVTASTSSASISTNVYQEKEENNATIGILIDCRPTSDEKSLPPHRWTPYAQLSCANSKSGDDLEGLDGATRSIINLDDVLEESSGVPDTSRTTGEENSQIHGGRLVEWHSLATAN